MSWMHIFKIKPGNTGDINVFSILWLDRSCNKSGMYYLYKIISSLNRKLEDQMKIPFNFWRGVLKNQWKSNDETQRDIWLSCGKLGTAPYSSQRCPFADTVFWIKAQTNGGVSISIRLWTVSHNFSLESPKGSSFSLPGMVLSSLWIESWLADSWS